MNDIKVPKRIENSIINALQGGVVPRVGLGYIAVGREQEIKALLKDIEIIQEGGSTFRFLTGDYGSGKTFLLQTIKEHVMAKGFVVADADLSPERSLVGTGNKKKGLATYRELMKNLSIKTSPEGGALALILDNWIDSMWMEAAKSISGGVSGLNLEKMVTDSILTTIMDMQVMVHGYDFSNMLIIYWKAYKAGDIETKAKALRWLRGEYQLKRDAKEDLGINNIINDGDWFDYIKIWSEFFKKINYNGFLIMIDEMINIYRYRNSATRYNNYETMLMMYNDALQGKAKSLGIIMGGTPKALEDPVKGVFSYEALKSRLSAGRFTGHESVNLMAPIIRIQPLTDGMILDSYNVEKLDVSNYRKAFGDALHIGIRITSNHLHPVYNKGDILLISRNPIRDGDTGIFINAQNKRAYIRKLHQKNPCELTPINNYGETFYVDSDNVDDMSKWIKFGHVLCKVR